MKTEQFKKYEYKNVYAALGDNQFKFSAFS